MSVDPFTAAAQLVTAVVATNPLDKDGNVNVDGAMAAFEKVHARFKVVAAESQTQHFVQQPQISGGGAAALPAPSRNSLADALARLQMNSVDETIKPACIVCLEDGKQLKMLKRHLMSKYTLTPDQYRAKWGLPASYPMVAPDYAATRSTLARELGLGKKRAVGGGIPPAADPIPETQSSVPAPDFMGDE